MNSCSLRHGAAVALLALLAVAPAALADDAQAKKLLDEAYKKNSEGDTPGAVKLGEEALAANPTDKKIRCQVLSFLGFLNQVKTGDIDKALGYYDQVIQSLVGLGEKENELKQVKADAMVRKANLLYSEKDDNEGALRLMSSAHQTWPLSTTAEIASQFFYRQGRMKSGPEQTKAFEGALKLVEEALILAGKQQFKDERARALHVAKCKMQQALVQHAMGNAEGAKATYDAIPAADRDDNVSLQYQWSQYLARTGDAEGATAKLTKFMDTRPAGEAGARARNQLRKFIRNEPDFAELKKRPDWKRLTENELEPKKTK
jgi:hypothetical protein